MNKKLIKQLEGVGFEFVKEFLELKLDGFSFIYTKDYLQVCALEKMNPVAPNVYCPTFVNILNSIKWHTGADLTKKTKREEIEELKKQLKKFNSNFENYRVFSEGTKDELKERIEQLEEKTKGLNLEYRFDPESKTTKSPVKEIAKVRQDETILNEKAMKSMQGMCDKQASEMQAEEAKGIEVGDKVIKKGDGDYFRNGVKLIIKGKKTDHNCYWCQSESMPTIEKYVHERDLQHAPKEKALEFGDPLESLVDFDGLRIGQKVVFLAKSTEEYNNDVPEGLRKYDVIDEYTNHYSITADSFKGFESKGKI